MRVLRARNVNDLYVQGMELLAEHGQRAESRAGPVVAVPWPVMSVYERPSERVLFDPLRDANPFFHLMEGLWMLAGRNDATYINRYVKDFGQRFGEKDGTIHDAYGHRWKSALGFDQLKVVINRLRKDPNDRQCVLQMWDARYQVSGPTVLHPPTTFGANDLLGNWRGRPCNTHAYFRVRRVPDDHPLIGTVDVHQVLDMTICCRSNDIVWGAYGANAVHFSMLQEYMAGRIGCEVGTLYQLSNNFHGYVEVLDKLGDPAQLPDVDWYDRIDNPVAPMPMGTDWSTWDEDLVLFMKWHDSSFNRVPLDQLWSLDELRALYNPWFVEVAGPVALARWMWTRDMRHAALDTVGMIKAEDWRLACTRWMQRRLK